jgi:hypothetical protein
VENDERISVRKILSPETTQYLEELRRELANGPKSGLHGKIINQEALEEDGTVQGSDLRATPKSHQRNRQNETT